MIITHDWRVCRAGGTREVNDDQGFLSCVRLSLIVVGDPFLDRPCLTHDRAATLYGMGRTRGGEGVSKTRLYLSPLCRRASPVINKFDLLQILSICTADPLEAFG